MPKFGNVVGQLGGRGGMAKRGTKGGDFTNRVVHLQRKVGKNSVIVPEKNSNVWYRYDLQGAPHKGVKTPHVQRLFRNVDHNGKVFWNKDSKWVRSMTKKDLENLEKHLKSIKND